MDQAILMLPVAAYFMSAITGIVGMGGGLMLLIIMSDYLPFTALIPIHGVIQLMTHASRSAVSISVVDYNLVLQFGIGALFGVFIGSFIILDTPVGLFKLLLALFTIICLLMPKIKNFKEKRIKYKWPLVGAFSSFSGLFVGATGVIIAPFFLSESLDKERLIATKAACQVFIHGAKVAAFIYLGFIFGPYLILISAMCLMSFAGSYTSKNLLAKIPEKEFLFIFQGVVLLLALRLFYNGFLELNIIS